MCYQIKCTLTSDSHRAGTDSYLVSAGIISIELYWFTASGCLIGNWEVWSLTEPLKFCLAFLANEYMKGGGFPLPGQVLGYKGEGLPPAHSQWS